MKKAHYYVLTIAFIIAVIIQLIGFNHHLSDEHGFRQTQTAISVYYLLKDGYSIFYETPVFGYPWKIPFEFPVYQTVVFIFVKLFNLGLDQAGRIVSLLFYYGVLVFFSLILKELKLNTKQMTIVLLCTILSPVYLFWSRTFLIESSALFFSIGFLYFAIKLIKTNYYKNLILAFIFLVFGALAKLTSVLPSLVFLLFYLLKNNRNDLISKRYCVYYIIMVISIIPAIMYTHYADLLKSENYYGLHITSKALSTWNFGTLSDRLNVMKLRQIGDHTNKNLGFLIIPCLLTYLLNFGKRSYLQHVSLLAYLSSILVFYNLYFVHSYYYYSNAVFGLFFVGLEISSLVGSNDKYQNIKYTFAIIIIIFINLISYRVRYYHNQADQYANDIIVKRGEVIRSLMNESQISVICGGDWSSEIPYYSQRRSIMTPDWMNPFSNQTLQQVINASGGENIIGMVAILDETNNKYCSAIERYFSSNVKYQFIIGADKYLILNVTGSQFNESLYHVYNSNGLTYYPSYDDFRN